MCVLAKNFQAHSKSFFGRDSQNGILIWGFKGYSERVGWGGIILESVVK